MIEDPLRVLAVWAGSLRDRQAAYESVALVEALSRAGAYAALGRIVSEDDARRSIVEADGACEVYFLRESGMGAIKIGVTIDLERRISSMQSNTPHEVTLLGRIPADDRLETFLKDCFAHARIRGEWFRPIPELMQYISTLPSRSDGNTRIIA